SGRSTNLERSLATGGACSQVGVLPAVAVAPLGHEPAAAGAQVVAGGEDAAGPVDAAVVAMPVPSTGPPPHVNRHPRAVVEREHVPVPARVHGRLGRVGAPAVAEEAPVGAPVALQVLVEPGLRVPAGHVDA